MMITCQRKKIAKKWQYNDLRNSKYDPFAAAECHTYISSIGEMDATPIKWHTSFRNIV